MATKAQLKKWAEQDARHLEAVRIFYETGDEALLGPVLAELRSRLAGFLYKKKIYDQELINDLAQDAVAEVLLGLRKRQFVAVGKLISWAMEIAWLTYADFLQRKKERPSRPGSSEDPFLFIGEKAAVAADGLAENSEDEAKAAALIKGATQVVLGLDVNARNVLLSYFYHGQDKMEAIAHLGINQGTYTGRLRRGLNALREWGAKQQAPTTELYAALSRIDTGELFKDRPHHHLSKRGRLAAKQQDKGKSSES